MDRGEAEIEPVAPQLGGGSIKTLSDPTRARGLKAAGNAEMEGNQQKNDCDDPSPRG
jgi:hypothetical protein